MVYCKFLDYGRSSNFAATISFAFLRLGSMSRYDLVGLPLLPVEILSLLPQWIGL